MAPGPDGFRVPNAIHFAALKVPVSLWFHSIGGTPFWCYVIMVDELLMFLHVLSGR
jgi:hypothetical protein